MNIHFIIITDFPYHDPNDLTTKTSINLLQDKGITYSIGEINASTRDKEAKELNKYLKANKKEKWTHVCLIPNLSTLNEFFPQFLETYILEREKNPKEVYMPIVELLWQGEESLSYVPKGFLNTCCWKSFLYPQELGYLDEKLANRQIDTTLYGCLIPVSSLHKIKCNEELKFFYHFDLINRMIKEGFEFVGIPKCFLVLVHDYELKNENQEEKREEFNKVKQCDMNVQKNKI